MTIWLQFLITIEEKSNPRKIIFRKSFSGKTSRRLANGRLMLRKKKEKDGRKDPLVESLLSQIKRQKLKHRSFRRNRTGGAKRPLPAILNRPKVGPHAIHHSGPSAINYGKNNLHYRRFLSLRTLRLQRHWTRTRGALPSYLRPKKWVRKRR